MSTFTGFLCFLLPLAIGLTFPLQVIYGSSMAGASSLMLLLLLIVASLFTKPIKRPCISKNKRSTLWDLLVCAFVYLSFLHIPISWIAFGLESFSGSLSALYLAAQAGLMYLYFSRKASEREINSFFVGMVTMGVVSGAFFLFESFNKLALGQITEYTLRAHEYTLASLGLDQGINDFRVNVNYRSMGLLERHSTSALWIALGFFAYLFLSNERSKMHNAFTFTLLALLIVQNFTAIIVFLLVSIILHHRIIKFRPLFIFVLALTLLLFLIDSDNMITFLANVSYVMQSQLATVFTVQIELSGTSYFSMVLTEFIRYGYEVYERPYQLLLGFGVGTNPFYGTSGDVGFIESMMRIGIPLWIFLTWKIFRLMRSAVSAGRSGCLYTYENYNARLIVVSAAVLSSIWLMDVHYSAWIYKSTWPIMFFAMALARRVRWQGDK